jgi:hypothetical protein
MLPIVGVEGRTLGGALVIAALGVGVLILPSLRVHEVRPAAIHAPWVADCAARMQEARAQMTGVAPELRRAEVKELWSISQASAELALSPQYSAAIVYRPGEDLPSVFDWEETATPVDGSFALHRHVGHFDLSIVADDADERGLLFAARMQPLLDECLMEAK